MQLAAPAVQGELGAYETLSRAAVRAVRVRYRVLPALIELSAQGCTIQGCQEVQEMQKSCVLGMQRCLSITLCAE